MSVQTQIDRLEAAKEAIATAIAGKGVTVPGGTLLDGMADLIAAIEAGGGDYDFGNFLKIDKVISGTFTPADTRETYYTGIVIPDNNIPRLAICYTEDAVYGSSSMTSHFFVAISTGSDPFSAGASHLTVSVQSNGVANITVANIGGLSKTAYPSFYINYGKVMPSVIVLESNSQLAFRCPPYSMTSTKYYFLAGVTYKYFAGFEVT